jgi:hypothetical protein
MLSGNCTGSVAFSGPLAKHLHLEFRQPRMRRRRMRRRLILATDTYM